MATDLIPAAALQFLPFQPSPMASWGDRPPAREFLCTLFPAAGVGDGFFADFLLEWQQRAGRFREEARKPWVPDAAGVAGVIIPSFEHHPDFGAAAQSHIAWRGLWHQVMGEDAPSSFDHVLEADTELDASLLLAEHLFYKQALQALRNYLEVMVQPVVFLDAPEDFASWKETGELPSMRGDKGVLRRLQKRGIIDERLRGEVSALYGYLNQAVHSGYDQFIHRGIAEGTYRGHTYRDDSFRDWATSFTRAVGVGAALLKADVDMFGAMKSGQPLPCRVCHRQEFDVAPHTADPAFRDYVCRGCGRRFSLRVT